MNLIKDLNEKIDKIDYKKAVKVWNLLFDIKIKENKKLNEDLDVIKDVIKDEIQNIDYNILNKINKLI